MEVDMETSPSHFDPEDLSTRERYRRYGKRHSTSSHDNSVSKFSGTGILYDGQNIERRPNAALFLEDIKQEVESYDSDQLEGTPAKTQSALWRKSLAGSPGVSEADAVADSICRPGSYSLKSCKHEDDALSDGGYTTFTLSASLLDSALQGLMPIPNLILQFERSCRNVSESIRYGSNERHRIVEDKLMRQKARLLLDEAASWSLLWYLYGKGNEELPEDLMLSPTTSHLEACQFVVADHTAQLGLRIVQWLEGLASKVLDLDNEVRGSHVGTYLPSSGVWHHTQRALKKGVSKPKTVHHLDFDAPTREHAEQLPNDKKQDESLLEDVWTLLRAGRLEEACDLCRSAGQAWRAATLCPFGGLDPCPSVEALVKNGKNRTLQAIELESGIGHQWRLWKWATYCVSERIAEQDGGKYETAIYAAQCSNLKRILPICTDWESACWAMAKSWLDVQVDLELARLQPGGMDQFKTYEDAIDRSHGQGDNVSPSTVGPENWPLQVLNQQPRHLPALLQKLHSSDSVHEAITQECKEQHRQIEVRASS
ncbi:nuclear pore complex protein NUP107-like [Camellia sinensis]|uniref:nuclear pore complex protein NUP107-like n=1 Tax=Camellia sinensis TaxID=4442 RepID=UPI0010360A81|nr:nuclear pore complex protein NUP107-like [Camellia sinensis]